MATKKKLEKVHAKSVEKIKKKKTKTKSDSGWGIGQTYDVVQATKTPQAEPPRKTPPKRVERPLTKSTLIEFLKENLKVEVQPGHFTDPNNRELRIFIGDEHITTANFDVVQKREYEG